MQDGTLHYWNPAAMDAPLRSVTGHQDTMLTLDVDTATGRIYSGDASGRVVMWTPTNDARTAFTAVTAKGEVPTKRAAAVVVCAGELLAASWDNTLRIGDAATAELKRTVPLPGQPKGIAVSAAAPGVRVVATGSALVVVAGDAAPGAPVAADWSPTCISMSADGTLVAVGGKDKKVHTYRVEGTSLTPDGETKEAAGEISAVAISPDGKYIAAGDAVKEVRLYSTGAGKETLMSGKWVFHTTRVTGLKWSPDSRHVATVGTDRRLCVWSPTSDSPVLVQDLANPQPFADVAWADNSSVWTLGTDGVASFRTLTL
ncbi:hypothetical protein EON67_00370 [archaeon]|nr:MAG: hypothetical protein EON67_00370 [archaeon]